MSEKVVVSGNIKNYIYTTEDSMYKVALITTLDGKEVTIVGSFPYLDEGFTYEFVGTMKEHPKYGTQLSVLSYTKSNSYTKEGLIEYLSSEKFLGIGKKIAEKVVDKLGTSCLEKILEDPKALDEVDIPQSKRDIIVVELKANYQDEQVFIKLYSFGLTAKMIHRLYNHFGMKAANIIEEDPYCLIYEVEGFGFKKSDNLALSLGFKTDDKRRIKAALRYTLNYVCYQQGFTFLTHEQLVNSCKKLLDNNPLINDSLIELCILELEEKNQIKIEQERYFEGSLYKAELDCADSINKLASASFKVFSKEKIKESIEYLESTIDIKYTPLQNEAILNSLSSKLSIITGGPGTGKSTILKGILSCYAKLNNMSLSDDKMALKCLLVAPTGRAAKRMSETTGLKASTIHKALGYTYDGGFQYNESMHLGCSLLIVDEASMLDILLASALFKALQNTCQVILVGDGNQLPSVGPGNVLHDLMATSVFKTTKLNQIMRQASDSNIITLSHMVLNEKINYQIFSSKKEVFFYDCDSKTLETMLFRILDSFIKNGGNIQSDIQILIPMYAGVAGIDAVNSAIQARYNKETDKILKRDNALFKKNDKVLQLKNDSELDIMNGDIGYIADIIKIDNKDAMIINFDGRMVTYYANNIDNLKLAYAISIHKSQGSEFPNVILPILPSYQIMLKKKIIYTAMTRAKSKLIVLGKLESLEKAIHFQDYERQTGLIERIKSDKKSNFPKLFDPTMPFEVFGEYDMEGITPYTFMK